MSARKYVPPAIPAKTAVYNVASDMIVDIRTGAPVRLDSGYVMFWSWFEETVRQQAELMKKAGADHTRAASHLAEFLILPLLKGQ
jgi:hypothetical protein